MAAQAAGSGQRRVQRNVQASNAAIGRVGLPSQRCAMSRSVEIHRYVPRKVDGMYRGTTRHTSRTTSRACGRGRGCPPQDRVRTVLCTYVGCGPGQTCARLQLSMYRTTVSTMSLSDGTCLVLRQARRRRPRRRASVSKPVQLRRYSIGPTPAKGWEKALFAAQNQRKMHLLALPGSRASRPSSLVSDASLQPALLVLNLAACSCLSSRQVRERVVRCSSLIPVLLVLGRKNIPSLG